MSLRTEKKLATKQQIMEAANEFFRTKGLAETTVREIARQVRISEPTFYNYFRDKEAVLDALAMDWLAKATKLVQQQHQGSTREYLRRYVLRQCDAILADREFARLVITRSTLFNFTDRSAREGSSAERELSLAAFGALTSVIQVGQCSGEFRDDVEARMLAEVLHGSVTFSMRLWVTKYWPKEKGLKRKVNETLDILFDGWTA